MLKLKFSLIEHGRPAINLTTTADSALLVAGEQARDHGCGVDVFDTQGRLVATAEASGKTVVSLWATALFAR